MLNRLIYTYLETPSEPTPSDIEFAKFVTDLIHESMTGRVVDGPSPRTGNFSVSEGLVNRTFLFMKQSHHYGIGTEPGYPAEQPPKVLRIPNFNGMEILSPKTMPSLVKDNYSAVTVTLVRKSMLVPEAIDRRQIKPCKLAYCPEIEPWLSKLEHYDIYFGLFHDVRTPFKHTS